MLTNSTILVGSRLIVLAILFVLALSIVHYQPLDLTASAEVQTRKQEKRARPKRENNNRSRTRANPRPRSFEHQHHGLPELSCSDCHAIPSLARPDLIAAASKKSIKGYPYHDSCLGCHRVTAPQFFLGTTPVVCTVCHTRSGPRLSARDMHAFPKSSAARAQELLGYFPHGITGHRADQSPQSQHLECTTCHKKDERPSMSIPAGDKEEPPANGTFKTLPTGHASCFENCHWDKAKPTKDDCAGCHMTRDAFAGKKRILLPPSIVESLKDWPREWPKRLSLKFNHESANHRKEENPELVCSSCHVSIWQSETLDVPDVPIATCAKSSCHGGTASRTSIRKELNEEDKVDTAEGRNDETSSRAGQNTCRGCHTDVIGSAPPPCNHYLLFGERYFDIEVYPKSASLVSKRCK